MSDRWMLAAGASLLMFAALGTAWWASDDGPTDASVPAEGTVATASTVPVEPRKSEPPEPSRDAPNRQLPTAARERPDARSGWVPESARDVVAAGDLETRPTPHAGCEERPDPVVLAKDLALGFERGLREATGIDDREEGRIGDNLERSARQSPDLRGKWDQPADVQRYGSYVQGLVDHLVQRTTRRGLRFRIHLVHDRNFNAFALPGGVLGINTGVFEGADAVRAEAELAAVIGHEIGHVELRHPIAAYQYARAVLGPNADDAAILMRILQTPIQSGYEFEADKRGVELAAAGQYDPSAVAGLWQRMHVHDDTPRGPGGLADVVLGEIVGLMRSHPSSDMRCWRVKQAVAELKPRLAFDRLYVGTSNIGARVIGPRRAF